MPRVNDILKFYFSFSAMQQSAQIIIPLTASLHIENQINKLKKLDEIVGANPYPPLPNNFISHVFRKFKSYIQKKNIKFDTRELRSLTYSLTYSEKEYSSIFSDENETTLALHLLDLNWRDSYIIGIIDCILNNWGTKNRTSLYKLANFIEEKLKKYIGNNKRIVACKNSLKYFDLKKGDIELGNELVLKNIKLKEASKYIGLPESWLSYPYFSNVLATYYDKSQNQFAYLIDDFEIALDIHNNSNTSKKIISKFINQANKPEHLTLQDKVKKLALKFVGDPENKSVWSDFHNASDNEKIDLINARKILNEWITRQFIIVFFNVCINDERRKIFWLNFASEISSFKVYGSKFTKTLLKNDDRIAEIIEARYSTVHSNKDISAFILYIGEYMIIEFSNDGFACCAYKLSSSNIPSLDKRLNSVEDLRNSSLPLAIQSDGNYYYTNEEGRLFHSSNWEHKFNHWLKEKVIK